MSLLTRGTVCVFYISLLYRFMYVLYYELQNYFMGNKYLLKMRKKYIHVITCYLSGWFPYAFPEQMRTVLL